ncbi:type IV inositol polyphosphate 5-phosphatase 7-like isoform X1 [Cucurbita maxima]|uniref:Type IV inositol polyphosphate 5-phosphatase 7-like isoform X1 n=1 Tax=Cucurbita maxima TaxID=3661 RepID=A0A6J1I3L8_CUCMA|nr:type IV inositol polyphosphate 5-phosphatase 7-like isoform X1 [Cucurbita maxima]XP_022970708.1 type IV inositol polyphosphate 5-phosphatase 7-like isoform X1 [Cucurbita maxima]
MERESHESKSSRFRKYWFTPAKHQRADPCCPNNEISDGDDYERETFLKDVLSQSVDMGPCKLSNELRIFVGTWNVAGRSPVGSLAVDLDDWLNLKDAADIYVLGFQEIVPLKTRTVVGAEDKSKATNWNLLIGKILNDKYGCPWLTPMMMNTGTGDEDYTRNPKKPISFAGDQTPIKFPARIPANQLFGGSRYVLLASKKMVGVFTSVWIRRDLLRKYYISNVKVCSVACGIMGYLGNKGSVSVSMSIEGTSFCFVAAHLASGEKRGDERRRNHQVSEIFRRTFFARTPKDDEYPNPNPPLTILGHDQIFWFGDLNYRLYLEDNFARQLIKKQDWKALQGFDQLRKEQEAGGVFQGWREGNIEFAPTYKYSSSNCNRYSGGPLRRTGEKQRTPAWCDRILWYGKGVKQLSYFRSESKFSDHRPVSAQFLAQIELLESTNPRVIALSKFLPSIPLSKQTKGETTVEAKSTLAALMVKDREESSL